ncbi:MAG: metallophosphoesterase [Bacteroidales bacterium]|nr:metallophosphoesterase [Bacteroidales bacterium]
MRGGSPIFLLFIVIFLSIIDLYSFRGIRTLTANLDPWARNAINIFFWLIPLAVILGIFIVGVKLRDSREPDKFRSLYILIGFFILFYVPKLVFIIFQAGNDLVRFTGWIFEHFGKNGSQLAQAGSTMTRSEFLTKAGILVAAIPFISVLQGIWKGRFDYRVKKVPLKFPNLPEAFHGFKVLHISDWHIGSFIGHADKVEEAVSLINQQDADLVLFTGDMVNNLASEMQDFIPELQKIRSRYGRYSILGNHDYGEYVGWNSKKEYKENMEQLFRSEEKAGFTLLRNESLFIEKEGTKIGLAGVENWGLPPFPRYGDLDSALKHIQSADFTILMSHDPSHWDAEILQRKVDLTLSGHTHGMQFGINIPGLKWSPVKWKYKRWEGLYEEKNQKLYVNVGIGYIAFPGRVGFLPEITVIELQKG